MADDEDQPDLHAGLHGLLEISARYEKHPDRAAAILATSYLDDLLKERLRGYLVDDTIVSKMFGPHAVLGSFSSRIDLVFSLGLIQRTLWEDLNRLRKIRNIFAHNVDAESFDDEPIRDHIDGLHQSNAVSDTRRRSLFILAVAATVSVLDRCLAHDNARRTTPEFDHYPARPYPDD